MASEQSQSSQAFLNEYRGYILITVAAVFIPLEILVVGLRVYARRLTRAGLGPDDHMMIGTLALGLASCANAIAMVEVAHVGTHVAAIELWPNGAAIVVLWAKFVTSFEILYVSVIVAAKLSVCLFYLRVFVGKWFVQAVKTLMAIHISWWIAVVVTTFAGCNPTRKLWYPETPGHCINQDDFYRYLSLPNILTDVVLLTIPLPLVWKLRVNRAQKVALTGVFLIGSLGLIASIVRFSIFFEEDAFADPTWASNDLITWTVVEPGVIIIAACLPLLRPVAVRVLPKSIFNSVGDPSIAKDGRSMGMSLHSRRTGFAPLGRQQGVEGRALRNELYDADEEHAGIPLNAIGVQHEVRWSSTVDMSSSNQPVPTLS